MRAVRSTFLFGYFVPDMASMSFFHFLSVNFLLFLSVHILLPFYLFPYIFFSFSSSQSLRIPSYLHVSDIKTILYNHYNRIAPFDPDSFVPDPISFSDGIPHNPDAEDERYTSHEALFEVHGEALLGHGRSLCEFKQEKSISMGTTSWIPSTPCAICDKI